MMAAGSCRTGVARISGAGMRLMAADRTRLVRVVLAPAWVDEPDRLEVYDRGTMRKLASWPLIERPARVALHGDLAVLSAANRNSLYALRITDGRIALIGITRPLTDP
jgi:hypothetical protein